MTRWNPVVIVLLIIQLCYAREVLGQASGNETLLDSTEQMEIRRIAIQAMAQSLRNVTQAVCEIDCKYHYKRVPDAPQIIPVEERYEEKLLLAYTSDGLVRYDRYDELQKGRPLQTLMTKDTILVAPDSVSSNQIRAVTRQRVSEVLEPRYRQRDPFVTVLAGVRSNGRLQTQQGLTDKLLDHRLLEAEIVQVKYESENRVFLELKESVSNGRFVIFLLTLDRTNGYVPLRFESRHNVTKGEVWTKPDVTETTWLRQGVYSLPIDVKVSGMAEYRESELTFHMKWKHVNEEIPAAYFSEESIGTQDGDMFASIEGDDTVVERVVRREMPLKVQGDQMAPGRFKWIMLTNVCVFVLLFAVYRWRTFKARKKSSGSN